MKLKFTLLGLAAAFLSASAASATTIATWTFETSMPTNTPGANNWYTNITAEIGTGTASALHAGAATYNSTAGNGSSHSFSANTWAVGDFYQFAVSTVGATHIVVTHDSISSSTGPRDFAFSYSTDGVNFTQFSTYTNGDSPSWSAGTAANPPIYSHTNDLSSITALNNAAVVYFRLTDNSTSSSGGATVGSGGTSRVDNFSVSGSTGTPPAISGVNPPGLTTNAGNDVTFTVSLSQGDTPLFYQWYEQSGDGSTLTPIADATNAALLLPSVLAADATNYVVVVTNSAPSGNAVTSAPVTLAVVDPAINSEPASQVVLPNGTAQFTASAAGTGISYQWYFCSSPSDNTQLTGPVSDGAAISGSMSNVLTIGNVTAPNNFVLVVTGTFGSVTSSVATLSTSSTSVPLAFWTFNGPFDPTNPAPYQGIGTASGLSVVTFAQPAQNSDANDLTPGPNSAWGTETYPAATVSNKQAGLQFNVSTLGAKNIKVSFDLRATSTASKYQRLQYTTNGTDFIDYPTSQAILAPQVGTYNSYSYDLTGFPGVANNANFGIRLVTEFENTALYGNTNDATYVGISAGYASTGTVSYDLVQITGDAITGNNQPPVVSAIPNRTMEDTIGTNVTFTVSDDSTPAGSLAVSAVSLDPNTPVTFTPVNTAGSVKLTMTTSLGIANPVTVPVQVTVTDQDGAPTVISFLLTITPANSAPVFTGLINTNMLANTTIVIPFTISDDHTPASSLSPTVTSGTSLVVPNDGTHLVLGGSGNSRTLTITPAANQSGAVPITLSAADGSGLVGSQSFVLEVLPNANVVLIDNFDYDTAGSLTTVSGGLWQNHSGTAHQLQVGSGVATIDGVHNSEDVNALLIGGPYTTNSPAVLYSTCVINMSVLPTAGTYFGHFKDNTVFGFLGRVWVTITNAAPGTFRVGIANGSDAPVVIPQDLSLNSNYTIVTRLVVSNAFSTIWLNPSNASSTSLTDTTDITTNKVSIYSYALREANATEGTLTVDNLKVGTSFTDVTGLPSTTTPPPAPTIGGISLGGAGGTNIIITGTNNNGATAGSYVVLVSTNIALPLSNWTAVTTQSFNPDGTFDYTNGVGSESHQYYILQALP
jgi:hypothetical protein